MKKKTKSAKPTKKKPAKKVKKVKAVKKAAKSTKKTKAKKTSAAATKAKKTARARGAVAPVLPPNEIKLGEVEDYFAKIGVVAFTTKEPLTIGDTIHVRGHTTDLIQKIESMQIEHAAVQTAKKGDGVGIKVTDKCRKGDIVSKVIG